MLTTQSELDALCERWSNAVCIGVDTEFARTRTYFPRLCLIQVANGPEVCCIDPLAKLDFEPLLEIFQRNQTLKVMHAAGQDLEVLHHTFGIVPQPLFDTQIAAALSGYGDQVGYAALVDRTCQVTLSKAHTRAEWCRRPLAADEIGYAEDDVRYLGALYDHLSAALSAEARLAWVEEECLNLVADAAQSFDQERVVARFARSARRFRPEQQRALRALAIWRESVAQELDLPREWVIPGRDLVTAARVLPGSEEDLVEATEMTPRRARRYASGMMQVLRNLPSRSEDDLSEFSTVDKSDATKALADRLWSMFRARCEAANVAAPMVATRREIEQIASGVLKSRLLSGWRHDFIGAELVQIVTEFQSGTTRG